MTTLRAHPVWRLTPRYDDVEVPPGTTWRDALAEHFGLEGRCLVACDAKGAEVGLDRREPTTGEDRDDHVDDAVEQLPDDDPDDGAEGRGTPTPRRIALSLHRLHRTLGLFADGVVPSEGAASGAGDTVPEPRDWALLDAAERRVAEGLAREGLGLDPESLDLERLAESFPLLPPGWESSPYEVFFVAALTYDRHDRGGVAALDHAVARFAAALEERLRIGRPDALDFRLHLFVERGDLERWAEAFEPVEPAFAGAVHGGWRRVVVHPFADADDRLRQMVQLGRRVALERTEPPTRSRVQAALGALLGPETRSAGRRFDVQATATLRPAESLLRERAEHRLLAALEDRLAQEEGGDASSGMARDLARRLLRRVGLAQRFEGSALREIAWEIAGDELDRRRRERFGGAVRALSHRNDAALREWLEKLDAEPDETAGSSADSASVIAAVGEETLDRWLATVEVDVACRLRSEIEHLIETEVLPEGRPAEIRLSQLFAALRVLEADLQDFAGEEGCEIRRGLAARADELEASLAARRREIATLGDPLLSRVRRWLSSQEGVYLALADALRQLDADALELAVLQRLLNSRDAAERGAATARLFEFADDLLARFRSLSKEIVEARRELSDEARRRDEMARLGSIAAAAEPGTHVLEELERAVEALPFDEAIAHAVREGGELRDLFHVRPDLLLAELRDELLPRLGPLVERLAEGLGGIGRLDALLRAALEEIFVGASLQPTGSDGTIGAFDDRTCLLVFAPPSSLRQWPDLEARIAAGLRAVDGLGERPPVEVIESPAAPGLILTRAVQGVTVEELVP